jgi:hypothetical protein
MGRFDALTNLEDEKKTPTPVKTVSSLTTKKSDNTTPIEKEGGASLLVSSQTSRSANQQTSELVNSQTSLEVNKFASKLANQQTINSSLSTKLKKKYGTYLRPDSIY